MQNTARRPEGGTAGPWGSGQAVPSSSIFPRLGWLSCDGLTPFAGRAGKKVIHPVAQS